MNRGHIEHSPDGSIRDNHAPVLRGGDVVDNGNKAVALIALIAACIALGAVFMQAIKDPQISDAKIATAKSEVTASVQQQIAQTKTDSDAAKINARVAVDEIERLRTGLAAKGIIIPRPEH